MIISKGRTSEGARFTHAFRPFVGNREGTSRKIDTFWNRFSFKLGTLALAAAMLPGCYFMTSSRFDYKTSTANRFNPVDLLGPVVKADTQLAVDFGVESAGFLGAIIGGPLGFCLSVPDWFVSEGFQALTGMTPKSPVYY